MSSKEHEYRPSGTIEGADIQIESNKPTLPPNVSIFSPKDPTTSETLLTSSIFSRLTTSSQTTPPQLIAALASSADINESFCLTHGGAVLVFDAEQSGIDFKDGHHEHVRAVCLALKDADIGLSISGCVFDAVEVLKAGFQVERLRGGDVMVVDLMDGDEDDDAEDGEDDKDEGGGEGAEPMLMGGDVGVVVS